MKKILYLLASVALLCGTSCTKEPWKDGDPSMDNVFYFGFQNWGNFKNNVVVKVSDGQTVELPVQFWAGDERSYDAVTYYYVVTTLTSSDYAIVDAKGGKLSPDANGAYAMVWPKAAAGVQSIYVKATSSAQGTLKVQTFDPSSQVTLSSSDVESTVQHRESSYEVRIFTENWYQTVELNK